MLKKAFAPCGEVIGCQIKSERKGRSKGKKGGLGRGMCRGLSRLSRIVEVCWCVDMEVS